MKKLIALFLVLAALASVACAAFTDQKEIDEKYAEAVNTMVEAGVISGFPDGAFQPKGTLTRAQAAKIITVLLEGEKAETVTAPAAGFADVPAGNWAEKYINYCADKKIVAGVGNGKFDPNGQLKGSQWAKMLLVAYGHDAAELTGDKWFSNTQKAIKEKGLSTNAHTSDSTTTREKACQLAYNFYIDNKINGTPTPGYSAFTVDLTKEASKVKLLGRAITDPKGIRNDWPASGLEFEAECKGDITLTYTGTASPTFTAFVDGQETGQFSVPSGTDKTAVAIKNIIPGKHTVRIVKNSGIDSSATAETLLTGITVNGVASSFKATAKKNLYIEFIGDSITAGSGTMGGNNDAWSASTHAATKSYAYLTAELLDADYSLVARGGMSVAKASDKVHAKDMYMAQNFWRDPDTAYSFSRKADVVVISLGANDTATPSDLFYAELKALTEMVRAKNPNAKIVHIYNIMSNKHPDIFPKIVEDLGGAAKGYYVLKMDRLLNGVPAKVGGTPHPSYEDNLKNAPKLADFIKSIL